LKKNSSKISSDTLLGLLDETGREDTEKEDTDKEDKTLLTGQPLFQILKEVFPNMPEE
jgi:hypothetical protein